MVSLAVTLVIGIADLEKGFPTRPILHARLVCNGYKLFPSVTGARWVDSKYSYSLKMHICWDLC